MKSSQQRDRGSVTTEYTAGVVLVAAIGAVIVTSDVGNQVGDAVTAATCQVARNCEPGGQGPVPDDPGPGRSQPGSPDPGPARSQPGAPDPDPPGRSRPGRPDPSGLPQHGWPDDQGPPPVDEVPAERRFNDVVDAYDEAEQRFQDLQDEFDDLEGDLQVRVWHPIARSAPGECAEASVVDCVDVGSGLTPHGNAWRHMSGLPKITDRVREHRDLLGRVKNARKDRDKAAGDYRRVCGEISAGTGIVGCGNPVNKKWAATASFPERALQEKYDEAAKDFGLPKTYNGSNAEALQDKIREHIAAPATRRYKVDHQGRLGIVFLDRKSSRMVLLRPDHSLWDVRHLPTTQYDEVANGRLPTG